MQGAYHSWYPNGERQENVNYLNGQKDGCDFMWDEKGNCLVQNILGIWFTGNSAA